jgi:hypothetical protein
MLVVGPLCRVYGLDAQGAALVQPGVERWVGEVGATLAGRTRAPLEWPEDPAAPLDSFRLGAVAHDAVRLLAVHAERTDLELPDFVPRRLDDDAAFAAASRTGFARSSYGHLLAAEAWLPADFDFTFAGPAPDGRATTFGSLPALLDQLRFLDCRTLQLGAAALGAAASIGDPPAGDRSFLRWASAGLARFSRAAASAGARGFPLLLRR